MQVVGAYIDHVFVRLGFTSAIKERNVSLLEDMKFYSQFALQSITRIVVEIYIAVHGKICQLPTDINQIE